MKKEWKDLDWGGLLNPQPKTRAELIEEIKLATPGKLMGKCPDCLVERKSGGDCPICGHVLMVGDVERRRAYLLEHPEAFLQEDE